MRKPPVTSVQPTRGASLLVPHNPSGEPRMFSGSSGPVGSERQKKDELLSLRTSRRFVPENYAATRRASR